MKPFITSTILSVFCAVIFSAVMLQTLQAQAPQKFSYQAVARNINGIPLTNTAISVRLNINDLTANGTTLYSERHDVATNSLGLFSIEAGNGTVLSGSFVGIDWAAGDKFLETSLDADGATGGYVFTIMGATQLISVPYSLLSEETRWVKLGGENTKVGNSGFILTGSGNTTIGYNALNSNTLGGYNTATGKSSLFNNTEGQFNTATGFEALFSNTTGESNTANGMYSLYSNTTASHNTAVGISSLLSNTTGSYNTAVGAYTLASNDEGGFNTAIGADALYYNTIGNNNSAFGNRALHINDTGSDNTATGYYALYSNTTGDQNTANGVESLLYNTSGFANTANGKTALRSNTEGSGNTANGKSALYSNSTGNYNTAIGITALYNNSTGDYNTAMGYQTLYNNSIGYENNAIGKNALVYNTTGYENTADGVEALYFNSEGYGNTATGRRSLYNNTTGNYNSAIGRNALFANTTGTLNCALGNNAYPTNNALSNYTGLGYFVGSGSSAGNMVEIGNTSVSVIRGQVLPTTYSDARIKDNITADVPGLTFIAKLRPVTYNLNIHRQNDMMYGKLKPDTLDWEGKYDIEKIKMTGFIAQEVAQAAQEVNYNFSGIYQPKSDNDLYGLSYSAFVVPLVKAVQEQQSMIDQQNAANEKLQQEIQQLKSNAAKLEAELELIKTKLGF